MNKEKRKELEKPLRMISPKLYHYIISEFKNDNIHSYDLLVNGIKKGDEIKIILRFGENFSHNTTKVFSDRAIAEQAHELSEFIKDATEACKKAMIDDYFQKMAP